MANYFPQMDNFNCGLTMQEISGENDTTFGLKAVEAYQITFS